MEENFKLLLFQLEFTLEYHLFRLESFTYMQIYYGVLLEQVALKILSRKYSSLHIHNILSLGLADSGRGAQIPGRSARGLRPAESSRWRGWAPCFGFCYGFIFRNKLINVYSTYTQEHPNMSNSENWF